jgi:hypothetical protein
MESGARELERGERVETGLGGAVASLVWRRKGSASGLVVERCL